MYFNMNILIDFCKFKNYGMPITLYSRMVECRNIGCFYCLILLFIHKSVFAMLGDDGGCIGASHGSSLLILFLIIILINIQLRVRTNVNAITVWVCTVLARCNSIFILKWKYCPGLNKILRIRFSLFNLKYNITYTQCCLCRL